MLSFEKLGAQLGISETSLFCVEINHSGSLTSMHGYVQMCGEMFVWRWVVREGLLGGWLPGPFIHRPVLLSYLPDVREGPGTLYFFIDSCFSYLTDNISIAFSGQETENILKGKKTLIGNISSKLFL